MHLNVEQLLQELLRFDRKTNDKVKVEKMTAVVCHIIRGEIMQAEDQGRYGSMLEQMDESQEGHA